MSSSHSNSKHKSISRDRFNGSSAVRSAAVLRLSPTHSILAGSVAGCVTRVCTSPLDVVKIHFQLNSSIINGSAVNTGSRWLNNAVGTAFRSVYALEGLKGFWKGNVAGCCRLAPYSGVKFVVFDTLKTNFGGDGELSNVQRAGFGALAGMVATIGCYPMEVVRTRMIMQSSHKAEIRGVFHGLGKIYRTEGLNGLYRGCVSGLVGAIPFEGVQFACYEYIKAYAIENRWPRWRWPEEKEDLTSIDYLTIGAISGGIAQTVAYPLDSIKKRLQAQRSTDARQYKGMVDCFRSIVREEGAMALYKGTLPNMVRIAPYAAVMFTTYESVKRLLLWIEK